jgi:hypothetical protein
VGIFSKHLLLHHVPAIQTTTHQVLKEALAAAVATRTASYLNNSFDDFKRAGFRLAANEKAGHILIQSFSPPKPCSPFLCSVKNDFQ